MLIGTPSLPARLCLLAWHIPRSEHAGAARVHHAVRAGALTELALRGLLVDDEGVATPVDLDALTGDPALDGLLELVRESMPHRWRAWVSLHARVTFEAVREQLTAEGLLRAEKHRALGIFPTVDHAVARPAVVEALRERARELLRGAVPVGEVPPGEAAFAVLAEAAGVVDTGEGSARHRDTDDERVRRGARLAALTDRAAVSRPALSGIVPELCAGLCPGDLAREG